MDPIEWTTRLTESGRDSAGPINVDCPNKNHPRERTTCLAASKSSLMHCPLPPDNHMRHIPDIAVAGEVQRSDPAINLDARLGRIVTYFRGTLAQNTGN
jgi:UDP-glucuronate decarboxylase